MRKRIHYTDEPLGELQIIRDLLPGPEQLAFRDELVKVTLTLNRRSVEFFKEEAAKAGTQYQRMIRRLVDAYAQKYADAPTRPAAKVAAKGRRKAR